MKDKTEKQEIQGWTKQELPSCTKCERRKLDCPPVARRYGAMGCSDYRLEK